MGLSASGTAEEGLSDGGRGGENSSGHCDGRRRRTTLLFMQASALR
jgi:hypothetical protein